MNPQQYKEIENAVRPIFKAFRAKYTHYPVGEDDLLHETLLKGLKRGLELNDMEKWGRMAKDICSREGKKARQEAYAGAGMLGEDQDPLWEEIDRGIEGTPWVTQKLVRLLKAGHSLAEAAESCGLSRYSAMKSLLKLRKKISS